jgi:hypothetical protein
MDRQSYQDVKAMGLTRGDTMSGWMRGTIVAMALALCGPAGLDAQQGVLGVKAGYSSFGISTEAEDLGATSNRGGFMGGVVGALRFSQLFSLSAELLYVPKGFKLEDDVDFGDDGQLKLDVIEIPVLANFHLGSEGASVGPRLYAGPWISFEASCNIEASGIEVDCDEGDVVRKSTDYGLAFGGALDVLSLGSTILTIDARYVLGLQNIDDSPDVGNVDVKTRGFELTLGAGWRIGG